MPTLKLEICQKWMKNYDRKSKKEKIESFFFFFFFFFYNNIVHKERKTN